ncbi:hypothetical protein GCM10011371_00690 [Novosphingobium marinum]|uniref:Ketosteroid isomerase-like protein n=1 Tax=Novosphingobium marinum TaxID=1514948 RepID=A0A7Y9XSI1_9SPHN|nr:nuclear transport factor 2 family protein [Novosphingobium marinum]NYH93761.1 ketosteroid isomerase-like protein [Novosphingobium marinum]GGC17109.1 hypothetical protein GCM10011371_00690 [Novosphingobium marinum]
MSIMPPDVRQAVADLMTEYCYRVDRLEDGNAELLALFTSDAVCDFSPIGLPEMTTREAIKGFYDSVFEDMTHHFHMIANHRPESWDGTVAVMTAYVMGLGRSSDGNTVDVKVRYRMECVEEGGRWKIRRYTISPGMPLPGSLGEIHGER